ncbi:MAG: MFS transporter [Deltaproteobacteria bacterium]|nr:MFS transporter [Deltaproteobacteria bacterium]
MRRDGKKSIFAWAMYDWANSAFATTVMAGFFPVFFKQYWSLGADATLSTARLGLGNSLAGIVVAISAPVLGAIADRGSTRKRFLLFFAVMGILMTMGLYLVKQGNWPLAILLYVLATVGFSGGNIFYDALITGIATDDKVDMVSSLGFSLGYLGGGLLFAINVWMTLKPETFGFLNAGEAVRASFIMVGLWWAVFSIPIFLLVQEPGKKTDRAKYGRAVKGGFRQLVRTFQEMRHLKTIFLFLLAYWLYIDGVNTIIRMAVDYGSSIGFETKDLISALLITQFVGFPSAIVFGYLGKKFGTKPAIFLAISVYLFVSIWAAFMKSSTEFYGLAIIVGLVQGGIQALSRSYYARLIPVAKSAEYFGFYNMVGRFSAIIGPVLMGGTGLFIRFLGYESHIASRISIASVAVFFVAGGTLFYFVNEEKGKKDLKYLSEPG